MKDKAKVEEEKKDEEKEDPKGIPEFWLTVFKNVDLLSDMLQVQVILSHTHTHTRCSMRKPCLNISAASDNGKLI